MTIERAVSLLTTLKSYEETYGEETTETCEALSMAIEALRQQTGGNNEQ